MDRFERLLKISNNQKYKGAFKPFKSPVLEELKKKRIEKIVKNEPLTDTDDDLDEAL
jgi:hypothetical protein